MSDPFAHLPSLRGRIVDPAQSRFRLAEHGVERWDELARLAGYPPGWRHSDEFREANRRAMLKGREGRDLWVFAYGSLMWDPGIFFEEVRCATLSGHHREFCLRLEIGRAAPHRPGLMAALERGGECHGLAFRIAASAVETESDLIWRREYVTDGYEPAFVRIATPQGEAEALAFLADHASPKYVGGLGLDEAAALIAASEGVLGSNLGYLEELARKLDELDIPDPGFFALYARATSIASDAAKSPMRSGIAE